MTIEKNNAPNITAAELAVLLTISDEFENGPVALLTELVQFVAEEETESGTIEEALHYIATEGLGWDGGREGNIGLNVRIFSETSDTTYCEWTSSGDSTWTRLRDLVDAINNKNEVPDWFDADWFTVQIRPGVWVTQAALRRDND